jgi:hypothetical protein
MGGKGDKNPISTKKLFMCCDEAVWLQIIFF